MKFLTSFLTALLLTTLPALAQTRQEEQDRTPPPPPPGMQGQQQGHGQMPPQGMGQGARCRRGGRGAGGR